MTRRPLHATPGQGAAARATTCLALALACALLAGCGARAFSRRGVRSAPVPAAADSKAVQSEAASRAGGDDAAARDPRDPYWPYRRAAGHLAAGAGADAEADLRQALALDPGYAPALALLSRLYFDLGRHDDAVALLEPVLSRPEAFAPGSRARLLAGLALHEDALGHAARARAALAAAADAGAEPSAPAAIYVMLRGAHPDSASQLAQDLARHERHSAVAQNNLGIVRLRAGDLDGAQRAFAAALAQDPSLPGPCYNLALLAKYYRFDDDDATRWFGRYWQRSHADPDSLVAVLGTPAVADTTHAGGRP